MARTISDLVRTMQSYFRIGQIRIKDSGAVIEAKNAVDNAYVPVASSQIKYYGATSGCVTLSASPAGSAVNYVFPGSDGTSNQVLTTDSAGNLSWTTVAVASNQVLSQVETVLFNSSTPITIFTFPLNATIIKVIVDVDTAFDATSPNLSVGTSINTSKYMGATDMDLKNLGIYEVEPVIQETSASAVIITFSPSTGGSVGSCNVIVSYANPD
jgi:hypothetical protein